MNTETKPFTSACNFIYKDEVFSTDYGKVKLNTTVSVGKIDLYKVELVFNDKIINVVNEKYHNGIFYNGSTDLDNSKDDFILKIYRVGGVKLLPEKFAKKHVDDIMSYIRYKAALHHVSRYINDFLDIHILKSTLPESRNGYKISIMDSIVYPYPQDTAFLYEDTVQEEIHKSLNS